MVAMAIIAAHRLEQAPEGSGGAGRIPSDGCCD